jgi:hypothetical protein
MGEDCPALAFKKVIASQLHPHKQIHKKFPTRHSREHATKKSSRDYSILFLNLHPWLTKICMTIISMRPLYPWWLPHMVEVATIDNTNVTSKKYLHV